MPFVSTEIKIIMPLLFIINILTVFSFIMLSYQANIFLLTLIIIKIISDYIFLYFFTCHIKYKINLKEYIILSFLHPFYIIIFSIFGQFLKIRWKNI